MTFTRAFEQILTSNPGAGLDVNFTMPGTTDVFLIVGVRVQFVTSGVAGARRIELTLTNDQTNAYQVFASPVDQIASETVTYHWSPRGSDQTAVVFNSLSLAIPYPLFSRSGYKIFIERLGGDAGDIFGAATIQTVRM